QAEDGIRDRNVTGVQTCALPICMAALLAGLPPEVPGTTVNRLCGSSLDTVGMAARAIMVGEGDLLIAGGVESMSRAPLVVAKAEIGRASCREGGWSWEGAEREQG